MVCRSIADILCRFNASSELSGFDSRIAELPDSKLSLTGMGLLRQMNSISKCLQSGH